MTREEAKHATKILQAYIDCKKIEEKRHGDKEWHEWYEPFLDFEHIEYRIKPEEKYVPYEGIKEFLQASKEHGPYIIVDDEYSNLPTSVDDEGIEFTFAYEYVKGNGNYTSVSYKYTYDELLKIYKWQDGTPCGKEVIND